MSIYPTWLDICTDSLATETKIVDGVQLFVFTNELNCSIVEDNIALTIEDEVLSLEIDNG
jgi:hypothetical protein